MEWCLVRTGGAGELDAARMQELLHKVVQLGECHVLLPASPQVLAVRKACLKLPQKYVYNLLFDQFL